MKELAPIIENNVIKNIEVNKIKIIFVEHLEYIASNQDFSRTKYIISIVTENNLYRFVVYSVFHSHKDVLKKVLNK